MNTDDVRQKIGEIAGQGEDVTRRVREVIETSAQSLGDATGQAQTRLTSMVSAAIDGASSAVANAAPDDAESTLRQVIDGIGEGLGRTAQATRLAVEESASGGKAFATEDLRSVAEDFKTIGQLFVETVERGAKGVFDQAAGQSSSLREHAQRTIDGVRPSLEDASRAALKDPVGLAGDSAEAAVNLARDTAGSLFSTIGRVLNDAGDKISPKKD